ncbi:MAG: hypothetical protein RLZZ450_3525 [Pseudomonadota bacterium]|jgi:hypothetical protein
MRAHIALLWLVALGACTADFGVNHSTRCNETTPCPLTESCYRGFCVQDRDLPLEVDGSLSPIREVEAGLATEPRRGDDGGGSALVGDAQSPGSSLPPGTPDGSSPSGASDGAVSQLAVDGGSSAAVPPAAPEDAAAPVQTPVTPPAATPTPTTPTVDPTPVTPVPTTPAPTTPAPTTPAPTTPAPTTPAPTTPTPVVDAGTPAPSVPASVPPVVQPPQSSPLVVCLAVCLTRTALCLTCLIGSINSDPSVCDPQQVRGDRELRELCDSLCQGQTCGGPR